MATRRERVILELEDNFTTGMARAASAAALLNKELNSLSKDAVRTRSAVSDIDRPIQTMGRSADRSGNQIDRLSGRMRIFADVAAILGPALVPIGAVGIPAVSGLAAQLGFATTAGLTTVLAFQGIGETLKTLNAAALEPTAENLEKAQIALEELTPEAQAFVSQIGQMLPELRKLRDAAQEGFFPGATRGLDHLEDVLPRVQSIVSAVASELGDISGDVGASLASDRWSPFLAFVAREAPSALSDMAKAAGNTAHAVANLWMATDPLNDDFSGWLVEATASLDRWAGRLSETQGFADFLAYVEATGPKVAEAFGAIGNAVVQILQAAAPLGGPVLQGVEALADLVAAVANSDLGTPLFTAAAGLALFNRTLGLTRSLGRTAFGGMIASELQASRGIRTLIGDVRALSRETQMSRIALPEKGFVGPLTRAQTAAVRLKQTLPALAKSTALIGGIAVASTGAADKIGLTNTASLALMGTLAGPWGAAVGGAIGLSRDLSNATDDLEASLARLNSTAKAGDFTEYEAEVARVEKRLRDLQDISGAGDLVGDSLTRVSQAFKHPKDFLGAFGVDSSPEKRIADALARARIDAEASQARAAQALLRDGFIATAEGAETAAASTEDFKRELEKLSAALTGRASFRDFEQAIDDFTERTEKRAEILERIREAQADLAKADTGDERKAIRQRIEDLRAQADALRNSLDIDEQAGRDTQAALDAIAEAALKVAAGLDPIARTEFLAGARTEFVKTAVEAGYTKDAANKLADELLGLSKIKGRPKIVIEADGAWRVISETERMLRRLDRYVATARIQVIREQGGLDGDPKTPDFATGGWTGPGSKYQPAGVVHADEYVFSKEATSGNVAFLDSLHQRMRGYANGGLVQRFPSAPYMGGSAIDYNRLAAAMVAARPLYGDVHISGDPTVFRREMEQDQRRSSLDGVRR